MTNFLARNRVAAVSADTEVHDWVGGSPWYGLQWQQEGQSWPIFWPKLLNFEDLEEDFPVVESQNPCDFWKLETISDPVDFLRILISRLLHGEKWPWRTGIFKNGKNCKF